MNSCQVKCEENTHRAEELAKKLFPNEIWEDAASIKFIYSGEDFELPVSTVGIKIASSRLTGLKGDEKIIAREVRQAKILADKGLSVYLLPKRKIFFQTEPDAIVNGFLYEFKTITGTIKRVEARFRQSRNQCENIFLKIDNINLSKTDIISKISAILSDVNYYGGTKGNLIFYLAKTEATYFMRIKDMI
jgi:hypothetical protein